MVDSTEHPVGSLGKGGLFDWIVQRVTGVIIAAYILCLVSFFATHSDLSYGQWSAFMTSTAMKVSTIFVFLSVSLHGWIGIWVIATDYMNARLMGESADSMRIVFLRLCALAAIAYFIGGTAIVWGVG